jgi:excisionase family DNA binding protein
MTYLTTRDLQDLIRVDKSTIYRMAEDGRIPAVKIGRQWRFPESEVRLMLGHIAAPVTSPVGRSLHSLLDPTAVQVIADLAGEVLGAMVVVTAMDGHPLSDVANPCGYFTAVAAEPDVLPRCVTTWAQYGSAPDLVPSFRESHFGFLCARSFIRVGNELLGMVIVGGIAPDVWPLGDEAIAATADRLGVDSEVVADHIHEVFHLDRAEKARVLDLLPRFGILISHLAGSASSLVGRLDAIASLAGDTVDTRSA